jgi:hypothetical protein
MSQTPEYVYSRGGRARGKVLAVTSRLCVEGCAGPRVAVRWRGGKMTYPCAAGMKFRADGNWEIR